MAEIKRKYEKPEIKRVELKLQEAVLSDCKNGTAASTSSYCLQTACVDLPQS